MTHGTMATTVGAIPIAGMVAMVGAILTIPVGVQASIRVMQFAPRPEPTTTVVLPTTRLVVRSPAIPTAIRREHSAVRATQVIATAARPRRATRAPFVARMAVTAIPTAISVARARPTKAIRREVTALRVVRAVRRVSAAAPTAVRVAEAAVEASLVAVPLAAVVAAEVAADLEAAGNYNLRMYHLQFI